MHDTCELTLSEVLILLAHFEHCKAFAYLEEEEEAIYDKFLEWRDNQD